MMSPKLRMNVTYERITNTEGWRKFRKISTVFLAQTFMLICGLGLSITGPLLPPDARAKGISKSEIGLISGSMDIASIVCGFSVPAMIHLFDMKTFFCAGLAIFSAGNFLFGLMTYIKTELNYMIFSVILRVIVGAGYSISFFSLFPILFAIYPDNKGLITALTELFFELGCLLGPLIASLLFYLNGYASSFLVIGTTGLFSALCCATCMLSSSDFDTDSVSSQHETEAMMSKSPENSKSSDNSKSTECSRLVEDSKSSSEEPTLEKEKTETDSQDGKKSNKLTIFHMFLSPKVLIATFPFFANSSLQGLIGVFLTPFLIRFLHLDETVVGFYFIPHALAALISSPIIGFFVDWKLKWPMFFISPFLGIISCGLLSIVLWKDMDYDWMITIASLVLIGICYASAYVAGVVVINDAIESRFTCEDSTHYQFVMSAWCNTCYTSGRTAGSIMIGGFIFEYMGYQAVVIAQGTLYTVSFICCLLSYCLSSDRKSFRAEYELLKGEVKRKLSTTSNNGYDHP
ncbi:MFS-type transporter SLC18B1-like [Convolutriloba macropyga]|uniref:MFS-type transporter SLC18B1-like n=1 Tax=Convolutriloba macropyga TaxID=536237 RepID=UPI003F522C41